MGVSSFFKNLIGTTKETTSELAEDTIAKAKGAATPMLDKAENYAELAKDKISEFSQEAGDALGKTIDTIKENAEITKDKINHLAEEAKELARDKISSLTQKENPEEAQNKIGE